MNTVKFALALAALATAGSALAYKEGFTRKDAIASATKKFGQMDSDGNGKVTPTELAAFMKKSSDKRGDAFDQAKVDRRWKRLDADGDGAVVLADVQKEETDKFDKADSNQNGKIDAAEAE